MASPPRRAAAHELHRSAVEVDDVALARDLGTMMGPRVIVADDDAAMREWLRLLLRPLGAHIREASGGLELLDLLAGDEPYDLVITDVRMPGPDGLQVVAMARTAGSDAPFLVITAFPDDDLRRALWSAGATLLAKPFAPSELRAAVAALLRGRPDPDDP